MIECLLAWMMLFLGLLTGNPLYLIASGVFAVASRIGGKEDKKWIKKNL